MIVLTGATGAAGGLGVCRKVRNAHKVASTVAMALARGFLRRPRKDGHFETMPYADIPHFTREGPANAKPRKKDRDGKLLKLRLQPWR